MGVPDTDDRGDRAGGRHHLFFSARISCGLLDQLGGEPEYAITAVKRVEGGDLSTAVQTKRQIAAAAEQQSVVAREIKNKLDNVCRLANGADDAVKRTIASSNRVEEVVGELKRLLSGRFGAG